MNCHPVEPKLTDALSDPVIRAVMSADHVNEAELAADLHAMAIKLEPSQQSDRQGWNPCREALWS